VICFVVTLMVIFFVNADKSNTRYCFEFVNRWRPSPRPTVTEMCDTRSAVRIAVARDFGLAVLCLLF
jgi:hypothetical protein